MSQWRCCLTRAVILSVASIGLWATAGAAIWTEAAGERFEADFLRLDGQQLVLRMADGSERVMAVAALSQKDQMKISILQPAKPQASPWASRKPTVPQPVGRVPTSAQKPLNFGYAWPRHTRIEGGSQVKVISENARAGRFVYESPNYRFICDVKLNLDVLRQFSVLFETTLKHVRALPLAIDGGMFRQGRLEVRLFASAATYHKAGGAPGTAACYAPSSGVVMAPLESLGVKRLNNSFSMDMGRNNSVLIHELAHQLTPPVYMQAVLRNGWFFEGLAEYVACTPYNWGYFRADPYGNAVIDYVTARGEDGKAGRALGNKIRMPHLERLFRMSYREFSGKNPNVHYGVSLMLVHYFLHMEGNGQSRRMINYLKGLRAGKQGKAAIEPLLPRGGCQQLEKDFVDAWHKQGIEIEFQP